MTPRTYWTSPRGILHRARDKANPYKSAAARDAFADGWTNAANQRDKVNPAQCLQQGLERAHRLRAGAPMTDITTTKIPPRTCTVGPSAVTGERCGKPAVAWFIGGGKVYAECAEHLTPGKVTR